MHKNWLEICRISDTNLRIALILCEDQLLLERLRGAFPQCFSESPTQLIMARSAILQKAEIGRDGHSGIWWEAPTLKNQILCELPEILIELGLPNDSFLHLFPGDAPEVLTQLRGKVISRDTLLEVDYRGMGWIIIGLGDAYFNRPYNPPSGRGYVRLIPKQFIDLAA